MTVMKKEDIEKILDLSYPYLKEKVNGLSLVDMVDITSKVWVDIQKEPKECIEDNVKFFIMSDRQLDILKHSGYLQIFIDEENILEFIYSANALRLESGGIVDADEKLVDVNVEEDASDFEWERVENRFERIGFDKNVGDWIIDHISKIEDILGFEIKITGKSKYYSDLVGVDSFGNSIMVFGDKECSSDETLGRLLSCAVAGAAEKVIWVAPAVRNHYECIIKWLNEHHYGYVRFYLIQAERIVKQKIKNDVTLYQLIVGSKQDFLDKNNTI